MRSLVNLQYILHAGYERGVGIRWDDPLLLQMRPEKVFLGAPGEAGAVQPVEVRPR